MKHIRMAIAGAGNCASAFIQGLYHYKDSKDTAGLLYPCLGGYAPSDIDVVAAFDIDARKVGKDLSRAIFEKPNCTQVFHDVPHMNVPVQMGPVLDGAPRHLLPFVEVSNKEAVNIATVLRDTGSEILINILPTGSALATRAYADAAIKDAKVGFINGIPEMIASSLEYSSVASKNRVPLIGDDFKSQMGTTILHRSLIRTLLSRGIRIDKMYQYNFAGNTDFANLESRGETKEITKFSALKAELPYIDEVPWGFAPMFIKCQADTKTGIIYMQGKNYGGNTIKLDVKIEVDDSANAGGVMVDMIRCAKIAIDRGMSGVIEPVCSYYAKHPPKQIPDEEAKEMLDAFIVGKQ